VVAGALSCGGFGRGKIYIAHVKSRAAAGWGCGKSSYNRFICVAGCLH